jgi:dephospho-CoA kinase
MSAPPEVVVIEVPLLVEAPVFGELADVVLTVEAPEAERIRRAVATGMSEGDARSRIACQASDDERRVLADAIIENTGDLDAVRWQVDAVWKSAIAPYVQ